nr:MAG TPA: hypothetical protein [Crassvirales sp.]
MSNVQRLSCKRVGFSKILLTPKRRKLHICS